MKCTLYLAALALLTLFSSCDPNDKFTGVWTKERNDTYDPTAFPEWENKGKHMLDAGKVSSPMFLRLKKELGTYVLHCYRFDGGQQRVMSDNSLFDDIKFKKVDGSTLMSDNKASGIHIEAQMILHIDDVSGQMSLRFSKKEVEMPTEKRTKALFQTMFNSGYRKLLDIRRMTDDPDLIDKKLRNENIILVQR